MANSPENLAPEIALTRLKDGNRRFAAGFAALASRGWTALHAAGQWPFATVLGCSDSRVPVELVFDQGLGDLFVVRIAGNIVAPSGIGSVEFAAENFGVRLVVVMGHTRCGAVKAAIEASRSGDEPNSRNLQSITDRIRPHIEELVLGQQEISDELYRRAVRANVRASVDQLRHGSTLLETLVDQGRVQVVGCVYDLDTGTTEFLEPKPTRSP
jgi:carbonic anhydrase